MPHHSHIHDGSNGHGLSHTARAWLVGVSGLLAGIGFLLHWLVIEPETVTQIILAAATLTGGVLVFPGAWQAMRHLRLDMNVLMTAAVIGAWCIGEETEAAVVVFLFSLSEWLEGWAERRAHKAIQSLLELAPPTALVVTEDGRVTEKPVSEVETGEVIKILSGARIPLDGEVISGASSVNQAPITGESVPVDKAAGSQVYAGTINGEGSLVVQVSKLAGDTALARIISLVEQAGEQQAPTQRFVDKFAAIYTPAVFAVALILAVIPPWLLDGDWSTWLYRALVLLVIACPCALVIATPVTIVAGLTAMARRGVLIKGGAVLENVGKLKALAVDKTGTITVGKPEVLDVIAFAGQDSHTVLAAAAAMEHHSTHPLAMAVVTAAEKEGVAIPEADAYQAKTGMGAIASIGGQPHFIGNHRLVHELGVCSDYLENRLLSLESKGMSLSVVGRLPHKGSAGEVLGVIAFGDKPRPDAPTALEKLRAAGLESIVMLSGDNQSSVTAIATQVGLDEARGDLLPDQKVEAIQSLLKTHHHVGMIGDGVNDAPALALSTVGIAMGGIGSDTAIEAADMTLMDDDLGKVADSILLGRRVLSIIRFNVTFALAIKAVFLLLAFTGHAGLWMAILADTGATLLVILNSLRLLKAGRA